MTGIVAAPTPATLALAARRLLAGELVAFPTETVYGLGADARNASAVRAIFAAKGRPADHPVIVHIDDVAQMARWARDIPPAAKLLADAFWPGALTLVLPRADDVDDVVTGGQDRVGLRVPSHPVARALLRAFAAAGGSGIAGPSANRFGRISPTTAQHVLDDLADRVSMIIDGGASEVGIESTIVAFGDSEPMLLRPGGIPLSELVRVLGRAPLAPDMSAPRASGTLASHYAPRTPARLLAAHDLLRELARAGERAAVLARTVNLPDDFRGTWIAAPHDAAGYAHSLYAHLRALDAVGATIILIESPPEDEAWLAVRDRLTRATNGEDDDRD